MVKSLEWMCDYCVEEEQLTVSQQTCQICKVACGSPEILKVVQQQPLYSARTNMINLTRDNQYVHLFCTFWFPEVEAADQQALDQITGIDEI